MSLMSKLGCASIFSGSVREDLCGRGLGCMNSLGTAASIHRMEVGTQTTHGTAGPQGAV